MQQFIDGLLGMLGAHTAEAKALVEMVIASLGSSGLGVWLALYLGRRIVSKAVRLVFHGAIAAIVTAVIFHFARNYIALL